MHREDARSRGHTARHADLFRRPDILKHDFGDRRYDLALLLGNSLQDIPHPSFLSLRDGLWRALEVGCRFVLDLFDGVVAFSEARDHPEETIQEQPEKVTRHFRHFDPSRCAYLEEYRNVSTGESCVNTSHIYTAPVVDAALAPRFAVESRVEFKDGRILSVHRRRDLDRALDALKMA